MGAYDEFRKRVPREAPQAEAPRTGESVVDRAHQRWAEEDAAKPEPSIWQRVLGRLKQESYMANLPEGGNAEGPAYNAAIIAAKTTPADRRAAAEQLHPGAEVYVSPEGSEDAGSITVAVPRGHGQAPRTITYAPQSGMIPGKADIARMAGEGALDTGLGLAGAGVAGPAGAYVGNIVGAMANPWAREAINAELPGGSTASAWDKTKESLIGGGIAAALPIIGKSLPFLRRGVNQAASHIPGAVGESSGRFIVADAAERAARATSEAAAKAAAKLGVKAGSPEFKRLLDAAKRLGVEPNQLPASVLNDEALLGPEARRELGGVIDRQAEAGAKRDVAQAGAKAGQDLADYGRMQSPEELERATTSDVRIAGSSGRPQTPERPGAALIRRMREGFAGGKENPEVAKLVTERKAARAAGNQARVQELNQQLDQMAGGHNDLRPSFERDIQAAHPDKTPIEAHEAAQQEDEATQVTATSENTTNAGGKQPPPRRLDDTAVDDTVVGPDALPPGSEEADVRHAQAGIDAATAERSRAAEQFGAAHGQRIADKLYAEVRDGLKKGKLSRSQYEKGIGALKDLAPDLQKQVHEAYVSKLMEGKVVGNISRGQEQHLRSVLGDKADDIMDLDALMKAARGKSPRAAPKAEKASGQLGNLNLGIIGALAGGHLPAAAGLLAGKLALKGGARATGAVKRFFSSPSAVAKAWNNPESRAALMDIIANGKKAAPSEAAITKILHGLGSITGTAAGAETAIEGQRAGESE